MVREINSVSVRERLEEGRQAILSRFPPLYFGPVKAPEL